MKYTQSSPRGRNASANRKLMPTKENEMLTVSIAKSITKPFVPVFCLLLRLRGV